jgi:hypothetical protein
MYVPQSNDFVMAPGSRLEVGPKGRLYETLGNFGGSGTLFLVAGGLLLVALFAGKRGKLM